jgi:rhodanese-related sulfurtransferase
MKKHLLLACLALIPLLAGPAPVQAQEESFDLFLSRFDYEMREEMKIDSKGLVPLLLSGKAVLVDIRFDEEVAAWRMGFGLAIPLNELPARLKELPKEKIVVTACPHKDRSAIAMAYLRSRGYEAKYLTDGLVGLAESLRGDRARDFAEETGLLDNKRPSATPNN